MRRGRSISGLFGRGRGTYCFDATLGGVKRRCRVSGATNGLRLWIVGEIFDAGREGRSTVRVRVRDDDDDVLKKKGKYVYYKKKTLNSCWKGS